MNSSSGIRTHSIAVSETTWSASCLPSQIHAGAQSEIRTHNRSILIRVALPVGVSRRGNGMIPDGLEQSFSGYNQESLPLDHGVNGGVYSYSLRSDKTYVNPGIYNFGKPFPEQRFDPSKSLCSSESPFSEISNPLAEALRRSLPKSPSNPIVSSHADS